MKNVRKQGERIRNFILSTIQNDPGKLTGKEVKDLVAKQFEIKTSSAGNHLRTLIKEGLVLENKKRLTLKTDEMLKQEVEITKDLEEDVIFQKYIFPHLTCATPNAQNLISTSFTEMVNNVIDHSEGTKLTIIMLESPISTIIQVSDNGIGIFKKIKNALGLTDERQSLLELSKGKFTTDPANHSGEGVFFTSRLCDKFFIVSNELVYGHESDREMDYLIGNEELPKGGTHVVFEVKNHTTRTARSVYDQFSTVDAPGFYKTIVPVKLAQFQNEGLVSRSQAKRLLARVERFTHVILDFKGIDEIGQAFADQIFRVFTRENPNITLTTKNTNETIDKMIAHVKNSALTS